MRLGQVCLTHLSYKDRILTYPQGYNTYLQKICIDRAVTFCQQAIQTVAYDILKHHSQSTDGASLPQQESTPNDTDTAQVWMYTIPLISDCVHLVEF